MPSARALRAVGGAVVRAFESGMVRRVAAHGRPGFSVGGAPRLPRGGFLAPTGFAPSARVALGRGTGIAIKHSGRAGARVAGPGTSAPSRQSVAASYLSICSGRGGEQFLSHLATSRLNELEGFVNNCIRRARERGNTPLVTRLMEARSSKLDVTTKGLLDALEQEATRLGDSNLRMSDHLRVLRGEIYDVACHEAGVRVVLRKVRGIF